MIPDIKIEDYAYPLTDEKIAKYPLAQRDSSKLLVYDKRDGVTSISDETFRNIASYLPSGSLMVVNDTKVVPARLFFRRETGARIEVFCLKPVDPPEYNTSFSSVSKCSWMCVIGNSKRWKDDTLKLIIPDAAGQDTELSDAIAGLDLTARLLSRDKETGTVEFRWKGEMTFSSVLELCGRMPIPPYLNRETEAVDAERYQTLYAHYRGSVAAPTAGLHFTEAVLRDIREKGIDEDSVCLHVGAGTFLPVKDNDVATHVMHREPFVVRKDFLKKLSARLSAPDGGKLIAVGTTSVRTLESLYYVGVSCIENGKPSAQVSQWSPYERDYKYGTVQALQAIVDYLDANGLDELTQDTRIIIVPGFKFRIVDILITNFHQPESTLILLVSAFVNGDWKRIYDHAINNDYRFLSYGDSSLLFREDPNK